ncbi:MAG: hypothetical protein J6D04_05075 [Clostridia bacterium]|nr:hypothetical protein [Clostridia bacterium]
MTKKNTAYAQDELFEAILALKNTDECQQFFEDLCTITEISAMAQRWEVAKLLRSKKTFQEVVQATGASTTTISRVNRCLQYGSDGYNLVLDRLEETKKG